MNLSISQWWTAVILDVPIKTAFTYGLASLISLGMIAAGGFEPVIACLVLAVSLSSLHFLCLIFGGRFVGSFEATNIRRSRLLRFVLVLISANVFFIASLVALLSVSGGVYNSVLVGMIVAATNLVPVLFVAVTSGLLSLIKLSA